MGLCLFFLSLLLFALYKPPLPCGQLVFLVHHASGWPPEWGFCDLGSLTFTGPLVSLCLTVSLQVDLENGLSEFSVTQRRLVHGWNEFVADNTEPMWKKYLDQVGPEASFFAGVTGESGAAFHSVNID